MTGKWVDDMRWFADSDWLKRIPNKETWDSWGEMFTIVYCSGQIWVNMMVAMTSYMDHREALVINKKYVDCFCYVRIMK